MGISGQRGAALVALNSSVNFTGNNSFTNNLQLANFGGAIHSVSSTLKFIGVASFKNNSAVSNAMTPTHHASVMYLAMTCTVEGEELSLLRILVLSLAIVFNLSITVQHIIEVEQ